MGRGFGGSIRKCDWRRRISLLLWFVSWVRGMGGAGGGGGGGGGVISAVMGLGGWWVTTIIARFRFIIINSTQQDFTFITCFYVILTYKYFDQ